MEINPIRTPLYGREEAAPYLDAGDRLTVQVRTSLGNLAGLDDEGFVDAISEMAVGGPWLKDVNYAVVGLLPSFSDRSGTDHDLVILVMADASDAWGEGGQG